MSEQQAAPVVDVSKPLPEMEKPRAGIITDAKEIAAGRRLRQRWDAIAKTCTAFSPVWSNMCATIDNMLRRWCSENNASFNRLEFEEVQWTPDGKVLVYFRSGDLVATANKATFAQMMGLISKLCRLICMQAAAGKLNVASVTMKDFTIEPDGNRRRIRFSIKHGMKPLLPDQLRNTL